MAARVHRSIGRSCLPAVVLLMAVPLQSQSKPTLQEVVTRVGTYVESFEQQMSNVVADEQYEQTLEVTPAGVAAEAKKDHRLPPIMPTTKTERRILRSDYALVQASDQRWVGFRDTYEVNGTAVRDREDRLLRMLTRGEFVKASQIASESARFNVGGGYVTRNVNVPVFVLQLLHPRNQWRFSFAKSGEEVVGQAQTWRIDFRERERPTFVRDVKGRDQPTTGSAWVDPTTGRVWRTRAQWEAARSTLTVNFGRVETLDVAVPLEMTERYDRKTALVTGTATYANYRQFQTSARLVDP
jgi:hypothetical protein